MAHLEQIANSLLKTLQPNTKTIKQAELYLERASRQPNFIQILLSIPQISGISTQLARMSTIYTTTYSRNLTQWRNQALTNKAAQHYIKFLSNKSIPLIFKDQISTSLLYLIQKDNTNIIVNAYISNMLDLLTNIRNTPPAQLDCQFLVLMSEVLCEKALPALGGRVEQYVRESVIGLSFVGVGVVGRGDGDCGLVLVIKILKIFKKYFRNLIHFNISTSSCLQHPTFLQFIKSTLTLNLPTNPQKLPIFCLQTPTAPFSPQTLEYFHTIKSLTISLITQGLRVILNNYRGKPMQKKLDNVELVAMCRQFVGVFVLAIQELLAKVPYFGIKSRAVFKCMQEIYAFLVAALRSGKYYKQLNNVKHTVIYTCIFKTLALSPQDYQNYYHNPQQFTTSVFQMLQQDPKLLLGSQPQPPDPSSTTMDSTNDQDISITIFDTIKTHAACLLKNYCKYNDGTTAEVFAFLRDVLDEKVNLEASRSLAFLLLGVLRDQVRNRPDIIDDIERMIFRELQDLQPPTTSTQQPYNIHYTLTLILLCRYLLLLDKQYSNIKQQQVYTRYSPIQRSFQIIELLLKTHNLEESPKIIVGELLYTVLETEESGVFSRRAVELLGGVLNSTKNISPRFLECISQILKYNGQSFIQETTILIKIIQKISGLLLAQLNKNKNNTNSTNNNTTNTNNNNADVVGKLWNILEELADSQDLGALMAETLRRVLQPLIGMIDGGNQVQLEDRVYGILLALIKKTKQISQYQLQILTILPKTFYTGKKKLTLSTSYPLLQQVLLYSKPHITTPLPLKNLILLCTESISSKTVNQVARNQMDYLQGILLLQSIIIGYGDIFDNQMWTIVGHCAVAKMREVVIYEWVRAEIVALLAAVLGVGWRGFSLADCGDILGVLMGNYNCLVYYHPCKLFIVSCCNLLQNPTLPFLSPHMAHLLDITITLLKLSQTLPNSKSSQIDPDDMNKQLLAYTEIIKNTITPYCKIDQFEYFRQTIQRLKDNWRDLFTVLVTELPQTKREYLKQLCHMKRVGDGARLIFRLRDDRSEGGAVANGGNGSMEMGNMMGSMEMGNMDNGSMNNEGAM